MKPLYYANLGILSFTLTVLGGELRHFSTVPALFYTGFSLIFLILIAGILPYRVRVKNPFTLEFLIILTSLILGVILWF